MRVNQSINKVVRWIAAAALLIAYSTQREARAVLVDLEGFSINADFEDPDADPGNDGAEQTVARNLGPGWALSLLGGHSSDFGVQDPADGYYGAHPLVVPLQGRQIGYINLEPFSAAEIVSTSVGTITAGQTYTLNVAVGARNNLTWSDQRYAIGLRVGNTDLGTFAIQTMDPGLSANNTFDLTYTLNVNAEAAGFVGSDAKIVIRGINLGTTGTGTVPAFTQVNFDNVRLDGTFGAPNWPVLTINRSNGNVTLNKTGTTNMNIRGYSITSTAGALNSANWRSIANFYDNTAPPPDAGTVDNNDSWTITSASGSFTNLAESELETGGDGGVLANSTINLGNNLWIKTPYQDIAATAALTDGSVLPVRIVYTGSAITLGDLTGDANINGLDWTAFKSAQGTNFTGLTTAQAYLAGDLDNDKDRDLGDFLLFRTAYDAVNGAGSFADLLSVPEPTAVAMLICGGFVGGLTIRRRAKHQREVTTKMQRLPNAAFTLIAVLGCVACAGSARAQAVLSHWTFDTASLTTSGGNITGVGDQMNNHNAIVGAAMGSGGGCPCNSNVIPTSNSITGRFGEGLTLTGLNTVAGGGGQFLTYPNLNELTTVNSGPGAPSYTVSYWINTTTTNSQQFTILGDWGNAATNPGRFTYGFGINNNAGTMQMRGQSRFNITGAGNGTDIFARAANAAALNNGSWHMMTWTFNTSSGQLLSYLDATLVDTFNSAAANFNMIRSSSTVGTWGLKGDTGNFLNGTVSLDEAWIFNGVLTQAQITDLYNNNVPPAPPVVLRIDPATGQAQMRNNSGAAISLNAYRILSNNSSLNPSGWTPISSQSLPGFPAGDGSGNGWETPPGAAHPADYNGNGVVDAGDYVRWRKQNINGAQGYTDWRAAFGATGTLPGSPKEIVEWYLQGDSSFADAGTINLGQLFNVGGSQDVVFQYSASTGIVSGTVEYGSIPGSGSMAAQVPEPASASLLLMATCVGSMLGSRRRRSVALAVPTASQMKAGITHLLLPLVAIAAVISFSTSVLAAHTLDRVYHFGDDSGEDAANAINDPDGAGALGGDVGTGPSNVSPSNTLDSLGPSGAFIDLSVNGANGKPKYIDVGVVSASLAQVRPGASPGNRGVIFDGVDDFLSGLRFNNPSTTPGSLQGTPAGPNNYNGIITRGFQLWVYPKSGAANQWIVRDTQQHGVGINNQGEWQLSYNNTTIDSNVAVSLNQWSHVMNAMPSSLPNREVMYVNGVAVAARQSNYTQGTAFSLTVGADTGDTVPTNGDSDRFNGVADELEMFVWGSTYDANTNTVTNLGQFSFAADNAYAATHLTGVAGDVNQSGTFTQADVNDFVTNWLFQKTVNGVQVGDMTTILKGDLNFDGITDLNDMVILRTVIAGAGSGSSFDLTALNNLSVPEPATWSIGAASLAGLLSALRRRSRNRR
jgi:hypothetical protein